MGGGTRQKRFSRARHAAVSFSFHHWLICEFVSVVKRAEVVPSAKIGLWCLRSTSGSAASNVSTFLTLGI